ncbi:MAG TPA: TetR/AcrR family transcriptional regulator [Acidimicrobiia bacterium]|nr:TetR/AcrR family transcriptional regulator [Acidimicrobiia bacterium]
MDYEQPRANERHKRILDAALKVFSRKGYRDTAVDDIAEESETSKGGVYFHFSGKQAIFLALMDRAAAMLLRRIEDAIAREAEPLTRAEVALHVVLRTFGAHRALARLFVVEALGAGREFHARLMEIHEMFIHVMKHHLDEAVAAGAIDPVDTELAGRAWFGAVSEVITHWLLAERPAPLEDTYGALRPMIFRSVGAREPQR